jgi:thiol-disulfide isomerase/thioredoxin
MTTTNWLIVVLIVVFVGIAGWFVFFQENENALIDEEIDVMLEEEKMIDEEIDVMLEEAGGEMEGVTLEEKEILEKESAGPTTGSYEVYAPEKLARANEGDVVLFFRASWCPTCRALDADIRANLEKIPAGLTILDVDYDNSTALKQKHGVTYQHTLVQVGATGNQIAKWSNSPTLAELIAQVK